MSIPSARDSLVVMGGLLWLGAVGGGMAIVVDHATAPGEGDNPARIWPEESRLPPPDGLATLVMFAHPRCPCTRSSLGELSLLMARDHGVSRAHVVFLKPRGVDEGWWKTDLWDSASAIPGVDVLADDDGREAGLFGAVTSGETLLYDGVGHLLFSGGITGARGHYGDNEGQGAVAALLEGRTPSRTSNPVFGCSLRDPAAPARKAP